MAARNPEGGSGAGRVAQGGRSERRASQVVWPRPDALARIQAPLSGRAEGERGFQSSCGPWPTGRRDRRSRSFFRPTTPNTIMRSSSRGDRAPRAHAHARSAADGQGARPRHPSRRGPQEIADDRRSSAAGSGRRRDCQLLFAAAPRAQGIRGHLATAGEPAHRPRIGAPQLRRQGIARRGRRALARWNPRRRDAEVPFVVARMLLQDFTGVPLLVDLAAMRSAACSAGGARHDRAARPRRPRHRSLRSGRRLDGRTPSTSTWRWSSAQPRALPFLKWGKQAFEGFRSPARLRICTR